MQLDQAQLVPGDILFLKEGDIVPADCKLLSAENLQVNEAQLTGESVPVTKAVQAGAGQPATSGDASLLFTFTPLPLQELAIVVELALLYLVVLDVIKVWYYRRADKDASRLLDAQTSAQKK